MAICKNKKCSIGECSQWEGCAAYIPVVTNADRIRAMSDEALAEWMAGLTTVGACNDLGIPDSVLCDGECKSCICKWLKQPAEEGTT